MKGTGCWLILSWWAAALAVTAIEFVPWGSASGSGWRTIVGVGLDGTGNLSADRQIRASDERWVATVTVRQYVSLSDGSIPIVSHDTMESVWQEVILESSIGDSIDEVAVVDCAIALVRSRGFDALPQSRFGVTAIRRFVPGGQVRLVTRIVGIGLALVAIMFVWRGIRANVRRASGQCERCGYQVHACIGKQCPECGHDLRIPGPIRHPT